MSSPLTAPKYGVFQRGSRPPVPVSPSVGGTPLTYKLSYAKLFSDEALSLLKQTNMKLSIKTVTAATKPAVKVKKTEKNVNEELVRAYISVRTNLKAMEERRANLQTAIKSVMTDGVLRTAAGTIVTETRTSYQWELPLIKAYFGSSFENYIKVDNALVGKVAEKNPGLYTKAETKVVEALVVKVE